MQQLPEQRRIYDQWVSLHAEGLLRYASRLVGNPSVAEDLVQETFLQAWQGRAEFSKITQPKAWLFKILFRQSVAYFRTVKRCDTLNVEDLETLGSEDPSQSHLEEAEFLQACLDRLPLAYRQVLLLVVMQQISTQEAADILEVPLGTVLNRLHRGRNKLKEIYLQGLADSSVDPL